MKYRCHGSRNRHKIVLMAAILLILFLYQSLQIKPSTEFRTDKSESEKPSRYLHQSRFRTNPDEGYETRLSNALRDIEREASVLPEATDTIRQIILSKKDHRKDDSYELEKQNPEWKYKVCYRQQDTISWLICVVGQR